MLLAAKGLLKIPVADKDRLARKEMTFEEEKQVAAVILKLYQEKPWPDPMMPTRSGDNVVNPGEPRRQVLPDSAFCNQFSHEEYCDAIERHIRDLGPHPLHKAVTMTEHSNGMMMEVLLVPECRGWKRGDLAQLPRLNTFRGQVPAAAPPHVHRPAPPENPRNYAEYLGLPQNQQRPPPHLDASTHYEMYTVSTLTGEILGRAGDVPKGDAQGRPRMGLGRAGGGDVNMGNEDEDPVSMTGSSSSAGTPAQSKARPSKLSKKVRNKMKLKALLGHDPDECSD